MNKLIIAKSLRANFHNIQKELLEADYMGDEYLIKHMRQAQEAYKEFKLIINDLRDNDPDSYEKLLGL